MSQHESASELLEEIRQLLELKGENPFKVRAYERAAHMVAGREDLQARAREGTLTELEGVGKGIAEVLTEFLLHGHSRFKEELASSLPAGLVELTQLPGLGPKKALQLIQELDIHSIGELEYACRENRLLKLRGFGEKIQHKILESILFQKASHGKQRLGDAFPKAEQVFRFLERLTNGQRISEAGALRRRLEVLDRLEFLVELPSDSNADPKKQTEFQTKLQKSVEGFRAEHPEVLPIQLHFAQSELYGYELAKWTATEKHWEALGCPVPEAAPTEEAFYLHQGIAWLPPETRETGREVELARAGKFPKLLDWKGVQGVFHNHTTRSDGVASLEEMVRAARDLGYRYIGISDHSQSAFYAQGLKPADLLDQEKEIRSLQEKYPEIRIFWGIESDILADGSLDYEPEFLKRFDFVIASVHSRFKMDREAMTQRIVTAIRNPYTRFIGHITGRLLLGREGYSLDMDTVIREAAQHGVAIEINAHPARLDIDWRWGDLLRKYGTFVSINPDAHEVAGLEDTIYGISVARKALLPVEQAVNARSVEGVEQWLRKRM